MRMVEFIRNELKGWGKFERIIFPLEILLIICISIYMKDNKIALLSAICGISYSILAGKGKISCFLFGLSGTFCYAFISLSNQLYGQLALYVLYYLPMQVAGIFKWKQHLKEDSQEIEKTCLSIREKQIYLIVSVVLTIITTFVLWKFNDQNPIIDAITTVFSVLGLILTVKRCIEQWYVWLVVNGLSTVMWIQAYLNGSNCFATILMWGTYFVLAIYFLYTWKKEIGRLSFQNNKKVL